MVEEQREHEDEAGKNGQQHEIANASHHASAAGFEPARHVRKNTLAKFANVVPAKIDSTVTVCLAARPIHRTKKKPTNGS